MRISRACVALVVTLGVAGCGYTPEQRAASGGLIGAGTGAAIASAAGGGPGAVIAGSLLGAGTGALIGANTRPPPPPPPPPVVVAGPPGRCAEFAEDMYGRPYCRVRYAY
jgi:hypothetical protein